MSVAIRVTARDGISVEVANWRTWRMFIDRIFTRPCKRCSGEGVVFWAVDTWHSEKCEKCNGRGVARDWSLF